MQVLLEDATAVFGQVLKYLSGGISTLPGVENALDSDLIYLRDPLNPWVRPFELSACPAFRIVCIAAATQNMPVRRTSFPAFYCLRAQMT